MIYETRVGGIVVLVDGSVVRVCPLEPSRPVEIRTPEERTILRRAMEDAANWNVTTTETL